MLGQQTYLRERMKYVFAGIACLFMSAGLVWAGSLMASCGNWSNAWLCLVAERVGGTVLAPGLMTDLYIGSKLFVLMSDTLFYAVIFFLISVRVDTGERARSFRLL